MENLSHLLAPDPISALVPTSQESGNMVASNRFARTAPGSQPVTPLPPSQDQGDPSVESITYEAPVRISEGGAKVTADQNHARPLIRTGQWNEVP